MDYPMTVESLLDQVGKSRSGRCAKGPGTECDHVVEYQLVVRALNMLGPGAYGNNSLHKLVKFFGSKDNLKSVKAEENQRKGQAVRRFLEDKRPKKGDQKYIKLVRNKWQKMEKELKGFVNFKIAMNELLSLNN